MKSFDARFIDSHEWFPSCQEPATKREGFDDCGRQRYHCRPCRRDFTAHSASAFSGYHWSPDVIVMAVRWCCSLSFSAAQVMHLLAERHIDVTVRTVPNWVVFHFGCYFLSDCTAKFNPIHV